MLFPSPSSNQDVPQPSAQQAHTCISTYMTRVEPSLQLFAPAHARQAFLAGGMSMWKTGEVPGPSGWLACYLAALAHGAMSMTKEEWHLSGRFDAREATAREWLLEAGRSLATECTYDRFASLLGLTLILRLLQTSLANRRWQVSCLSAAKIRFAWLTFPIAMYRSARLPPHPPLPPARLRRSSRRPDYHRLPPRHCQGGMRTWPPPGAAGDGSARRREEGVVGQDLRA